MAIKKPLVITAGQIQQLQSGDYINTEEIPQYTNGESSPIVIGTPVYVSSADTVKKAKADAVGTKDVIGLVYDASITNGVAGGVILNNVLTATTTQWDAVAGTTGGLTAGTTYFLSPATAGLLTETAPTAVGQYVVPVGIGLSTTEMKIVIKTIVLL